MSSSKKTHQTLAKTLTLSDKSALYAHSKLFATRNNAISVAQYSAKTHVRVVVAYFAKRDALKTLKIDSKTLARYASKQIDNSALKPETKRALSEHSLACAKLANVEHNKLSSRVLATIVHSMLIAKSNDKSKRASKTSAKSDSASVEA